jgi:hypothetical protein
MISYFALGFVTKRSCHFTPRIPCRMPRAVRPPSRPDSQRKSHGFQRGMEVFESASEGVRLVRDFLADRVGNVLL